MEDRARDEIRDDILERVFPELRYGEDPDIERYFELRASGRMLDALAVYRSRLRPRYPDDARRVVLLKLYRTRSPAYPEYLRGLMRERADGMTPLTATPLSSPSSARQRARWISEALAVQ